jgi:hypothetical protein
MASSVQLIQKNQRKVRLMQLKSRHFVAEMKDFYVNPEVAERFNLKRVELKGSPEAQSLIDQVRDRKIDITTEEGKKYFVQQWQEKTRLPLPCRVKNVNSHDSDNFTYLENLYAGTTRISSDNRSDFASDKTVYVDNWKEDDWGARQDRYSFDNPALSKSTISVILKKLGIKDGVISHSRSEIESALWNGDPAEKKPSEKHRAILRELGVFDDEVYIKLISYREYLVCSQEEDFKNFGKKDLFTLFDDYASLDLSRNITNGNSLMGGFFSMGGVAYCTSVPYDYVHSKCAIRLVLVKD